MAIMAKRGEYEIARQTLVRAVRSYLRSYGVTFNPASSSSRREVVDSGQRYEVRLVDGWVEISLDGTTWQPLRPETEPWSGEELPWGISYLNERRGEAIKPLLFDMIAVGRGRILAKQADTDQIFHLKLSELFRTRSVSGPGITGTWRPSGALGDPPVPSNYFKLDPEFFTPANGNFPVPNEFKRNYAAHPASLRFPLFVESMKAESSDGMIVPVKPRVWQLIDSRSPLIVFDLDDLKCIGDDELRQVATKSRIKEIVMAAYSAKQGELEQDIEAWAEATINIDFTPTISLPRPVSDVVDEVRDLLDGIGDWVDDIAGIPVVGSAVSGIRYLVRTIRTSLTSLLDSVASSLENVAEDILAKAVKIVVRELMPFIADQVATRVREAIRNDGFAALFYPGMFAIGMMTNRLFEKKAIKVVASGSNADFDSILNSIVSRLDDFGDLVEAIREAMEEIAEAQAHSGCSRRSELRLHIGKTLKILLHDEDNPALRLLIQDLVAAGRRKRGVLIPNAPPTDLPSYEHVVYRRVSNNSETHRRLAIAFKKVMDLGVGFSHWHEHWQSNYGGEMHNLLSTRPMFQQERYNLMQYRFINGPVIDGDGYNDGTTNFYMLVELAEEDEQVQPVAWRPTILLKKAGTQRTAQSQRRFAILWLDEQTYFTQRWRLLHPTKDTEGDLFSLQRVLRDNPEYFRFDVARFWSPFDDGCIDEWSRMAVVRQIVAVTGKDQKDSVPQIYTICFNYGVCDHTWRWRPFPPSNHYSVLDQNEVGSNVRLPPRNDEYVYTNTLGLREDATFHVRGFKREPTTGAMIEGRWTQKYLPADQRHVPERFQLSGRKPLRGFNHEWDFVSEEAYLRADQFFLFGVYEELIDARCQYYEVDVLQSPKVEQSIEDLCKIVWRNGKIKDEPIPPLSIDTVNFNWALPRDEDGYLKLNELTVDRGKLPTMSMYEPHTRFRLLERKPLGVIAVFDDKRDDELQAASHLPQDTVFVEADWSWWQNFSETPEKDEKAPAKSLRVRVKTNKRIITPPMVQKAQLTRMQPDRKTRALRISFWTHQTVEQVYANLWRASLGAIDEDGSVVLLLVKEIFPDFQRQGLPHEPLRLNFQTQDVLHPEHQYVFEWTGFDSDAVIDKYCTPEGHIKYGTSLWFENIVGHKSTAQSLEFTVS